MKIVKLWQSKNENYRTLKDGIFAFAALDVIFLVSSTMQNAQASGMSELTAYFLRYFSVFTFFTSVLLGLFYFYIFNNIQFLKTAAHFILSVVLVFLLCLTVLIGIPFLVLLFVVIKVTAGQAKKLKNLFYVLFFFLLTLFLVYLFTSPIGGIAFRIAQWLSILLEAEYQLNMDVFGVGLFLFLSILKLLIDMVFFLIVVLWNVVSYFWKNRKTKQREKMLDKNRLSRDPGICARRQSNRYEGGCKKEELKESIKQGLDYFGHAPFQAELGILIMAFTMVAWKIVPQNHVYFLDHYQGDIINVLTIYTLIILYLDKRKEWK